MSLIPIETMAAQYGIQIRGVIQIGARSGQEVPELIKNGVGRIHLVEANSDLIPGLQAMASSFEGQITISNVAISDANGYEDFHVTSISQSSSLLPLADHKIVYPKITEVTIVKVRTETLDGNVTANNLDLRAFNALFIDVQGAELKVLRGAKETLSHLDIVITEVNFEELYQGCPQIEDLDLFLFDAGFARVATVTPYHDSWGDALYIRTSRLSNPALLSLPKRHKVSMPSLGANGRFANQLFQYLFLSLYALRSSCEPVFPEFEAACFFEVPFKPGRTSVLAPMSEVARGDAAIFLEAQEPPRDIELWGYFQDITNAHLRHRELAVRLLTPKPEYKSALDEWWVKVREKCGRVIGLHIRRGDYTPYNKSSLERFSQVPLDWYIRFLKERLLNDRAQAIFIASDDPGLRHNLQDFQIVQDLVPPPAGVDLRLAELFGLGFCDEAIYFNSSWSFMAALLSKNNQTAYIVDFEHESFRPFEAWAERDFWGRFDPSAKREAFRQLDLAGQEQRLLDHWRTQAELTLQLSHPFSYAIKRKLNQWAAAKRVPKLIQNFASENLKPALLFKASRAQRKWKLEKALTSTKKGSNCKEISSAYR